MYFALLSGVTSTPGSFRHRIGGSVFGERPGSRRSARGEWFVTSAAPIATRHRRFLLRASAGVHHPLLPSPRERLGRVVLERSRRSTREPGYGLAGGVLWGAVLTSLLPAIERFFGVVTERRLLDLGDPSNKLLQVLRERAPGTYMHTLGVQQLTRNAAEAIGGDVLLAEVGAFYHDIGKIVKPEYFVENMGEDRSIHDRLRPSMSKMIIISHVKDGILLAREEKLPSAHHRHDSDAPRDDGRRVLLSERRAERAGKKTRLRVRIRPTATRAQSLSSPRPAFLMLADAAEAISKTIREPSSNRFRDMVREIIMKRLQDGQLDECNLTIADLRKIEDSFVRTLTGMFHGRINYPTDEPANGEPKGEKKPNGGAKKAGAATKKKSGEAVRAR